ncbi:MAG: hypothetical protein AB8B55_24335, partial [Mariniblastus sp.]
RTTDRNVHPTAAYAINHATDAAFQGTTDRNVHPTAAWPTSAIPTQTPVAWVHRFTKGKSDGTIGLMRDRR